MSFREDVPAPVAPCSSRFSSAPPALVPYSSRPSSAPPALMTMREVAAFLHVSSKTVQRLVRRGRLPSFRICAKGPRRFRMQDVERLLVPDAETADIGDLDDFINNQMGRP